MSGQFIKNMKNIINYSIEYKELKLRMKYFY